MDPLQALLNIILNIKLGDPSATSDAIDQLNEYIKKLQDQARAEDEAARAAKLKAETYTQYGKVLQNVQNAINSALNGLAKLGAVFGAQSLAIGECVRSFQNFNTALVTSYQNTTRGAMSGAAYVATLKELRDNFGGTYAEATKAMQAYEQAYTKLSPSKMQADMEGVRKIVGNNLDAMSQFIGQIGQIGAAFPEFQQFMDTFTMEEIKERASDLLLFATNAALAGKLSKEQIKTLTALAEGGKVEEDPQLKAANETLKVQQEIRKVFEDIANQIGSKLLPIVQMIAGWTMEWKDSLAPIVLTFTTVSAVLGVIISALGVAAAAATAFGTAVAVSTGGVSLIIAGIVAGVLSIYAAFKAWLGGSNDVEEANKNNVTSLKEQNQLMELQLRNNPNLSKKEQAEIERNIVANNLEIAKIQGESTTVLEAELGYKNDILAKASQQQVLEQNVKNEIKGHVDFLLRINQEAKLYSDELAKQENLTSKITANAKSLRDLLANAGMSAKDAADITKDQLQALNANVAAQARQNQFLRESVAQGEKLYGSKNVTAEELEAARKLREERLKAAGENEAERQKAMKQFMEAVGFNNSFQEVQAMLIEGETKYRDLKRSEKDIVIETLKMTDAQLVTKEKEYAVTESIVRLTDSLGMGIGAQMKTRMQQITQLGEQIKILRDQQISFQQKVEEERRKQASLTGEDLQVSLEAERKYTNELLDINKKILDVEQRRADVSKTMREGWLDAIKAMASGQGVFAKIVIREDQNLGILAAKRQDQIKTLQLGGIGEGRTESAAFTIGGFREGAAGGYEKAILSQFGVSAMNTTQQNVKGILQVQEKMLEKVSTGAGSFGQGPNTAVINIGKDKSVTVISNATGVPSVSGAGASAPASAAAAAAAAANAPVIAQSIGAAAVLNDGTVPTRWIYDELTRIRNATEGTDQNISANIQNDLQTIRLLVERNDSAIGAPLAKQLSDIFKQIGQEVVNETIRQIRQNS